ncbi:MAG: DUF2290 domain-containing protein [Alphaproteobacteria bacterium]
MDARTFNKSILQSWELVSALSLGLTVSTPVSLSVNLEFRDFAFSNNTQYSDLYRLGLKLKHYNILLKDYGYFQFSQQDENIRFAYYPSTHNSQDSEIISDLSQDLNSGLISLEDYSAFLEEMQESVTIPTIRYECSFGQYKPFWHPCAHFHIGHHYDNRWPVKKILSPLAFTMIIIKKYYGDSWEEHDDDTHPYKNKMNEEMAKVKKLCPTLDDVYFTQKENEIFHFL